MKYRGFHIALNKKSKAWSVAGKPFYYYDFPNDLTASSKSELMEQIDQTLKRLKYL